MGWDGKEWDGDGDRVVMGMVVCMAVMVETDQHTAMTYLTALAALVMAQERHVHDPSVRNRSFSQLLTFHHQPHHHQHHHRYQTSLLGDPTSVCDCPSVSQQLMVGW